MTSFALGVASAVILGVVTEVLTGWLSRALRRLRLWWHGRRSIAYDLRQDELFMLAEWSPARRLEPHRLITNVTPEGERPAQPWIDEELFSTAVQESSSSSGELVYFTGMRLDYRESEDTQTCRVQLAESQYPEVLAVERLRIQQPQVLKACDEAIAKDANAYIRTAIPASIAINLVPITADDEMLCVERSSAVDSAVGLWTVGVFETMKRSDPNLAGSSEDLYSLAIRGLNEELGLRPHEFGTIMISWVGLYRPILRGHVVAITRLKIPREDAVAHAREAHSGFEHAQLDWLRLRRPLVQSFVRAPRSTSFTPVGASLDVDRRQWIDQSRLAALEAWRFRMALDD